MAFKDLREYIAELESRGLLKRITTEVDCQLEITEITDRVSKMEGNKNVALLFENVKGYDMPVLMNAFGSMERMAIAFGVEKLDDVADEMLPNRLYPLYKKMLLWQERGNVTQAKKCAGELLRRVPKRSSSAVKDMQAEACRILNVHQ